MKTTTGPGGGSLTLGVILSSTLLACLGGWEGGRGFSSVSACQEAQKRCKNCNVAAPASQKFCGACGAKLPESAEKQPKVKAMPGGRIGETYTDKEYGISIQIPRGWTVRKKEFQYGLQGTILELQVRTEIFAVLGVDDFGSDPKAIVQGHSQTLKLSSDKIELLGGKDPPGGPVGALFRTSKDTNAMQLLYMRHAIFAWKRAEKTYWLGVSGVEASWLAQEKIIDAFIRSWNPPTPKKPPVKTVKPKEIDRPGDPDVEIKDRRYRHRKLDLSLEVPKGWILRGKDFEFGVKGTLVEFARAQGPAGVLAAVSVEMDARKFAETSVKSIERVSDRVETLSQARAQNGAVRVDFRATKDKETTRYALIVVSRKGRVFSLISFAEEGVWKGFSRQVDLLLETLVIGNERIVTGDRVGDTKPQGPQKRLPNPWKGCKKGSWARYKVVSESGGNRREMEVTYVLEDAGDDSYYVMRTDMVVAGRTYKGKPVRMDLAVHGADKFREASEKESVGVPKGQFLCARRERKSARGRTVIWENPEIPFRIVKRLDEGGGTTSTSVLVDFKAIQ